MLVHDSDGSHPSGRWPLSQASAVRVLATSGEYLGSSPEAECADRCCRSTGKHLGAPPNAKLAPPLDQRDGPARSRRAVRPPGRRTSRRRPARAAAPGRMTVGRAQPGGQLVRRLGGHRLAPSSRMIADQLVAPAAVGVVRGAEVGVERRAAADCEVWAPSTPRRRPRRARRRARPAARRSRSSEHRQVLGDRRRHRRQQPGERAALGLDGRGRPGTVCSRCSAGQHAAGASAARCRVAASGCVAGVEHLEVGPCMAGAAAQLPASGAAAVAAGRRPPARWPARPTTSSTRVWSASTGGAGRRGQGPPDRRRESDVHPPAASPMTPAATASAVRRVVTTRAGGHGATLSTRRRVRRPRGAAIVGQHHHNSTRRSHR